MMEISRRGLLAGIGAVAMPFGESRTTGFSNSPLARLIVANSIINKNGMFFYSGTPAFGNLIESVGVQTGGTDKFNNLYLPGNTTYGLISGTFYAVQQIGRGFTFLTAPAANGPWTNIASIIPIAGGQFNFLAGTDLFLNPNSGAGRILVTGNVVTFITGTGAETWHVIGAASQPPFLNSFSAGGTAPRFQREPINGGRVRLSGAVNTGAVNAAGTAMFTLPVGYRPSRTINFVTQNNITAYTLGSGSVEVHTTGDVVCVPATTAGKFVLIDGICFELD